MLADMFINKLTFFTEWFQMQEMFKTPFEMSPIQLDKYLQKFYLSARKRDGSYYFELRACLFNLRAKVVNKRIKNRHLRSFQAYYLTVLAYTKTIIHLIVGGQLTIIL